MKLILPIEVTAGIEPHLSPNARVVRVDSDGNLDGDASDAEVYLNWFSLTRAVCDRVLDAAPSLRWQHTPSVRVNELLTPKALARNLMLTNGAGVQAIPMAELAIASILNHAKSLPKLQTLPAGHSGRREWMLPELRGATVLIVGAGAVGCEIAKRATRLGMRVWGSRCRPQPHPYFERVVGADKWRSLLPDADYVVIATPLTSKTQGMIDLAALLTMRRSAYLINLTGGAVADEGALVKALREGWIAGTAIHEPLWPDSPFWSLANVSVTPYCSEASPEFIERSLALFLENLRRYQTGMSLRNVVDRRVGY